MIGRTLLAVLLVVPTGCGSPRPTEVTNVAFTLSVDTSSYRTWGLDPAACEDFDLEWVDGGRVFRAWESAMHEFLSGGRYTYAPAEEADFLFSYEFWIEEGSTRESVGARAMGSLVIREGGSGEFLWRATRKTQLDLTQPDTGLEEGVREFTADLLSHISVLTRLLEAPGSVPEGDRVSAPD